MGRKDNVHLPCNLRNVLFNPVFEFLCNFEVLRVLLKDLDLLESADLDGWALLPEGSAEIQVTASVFRHVEGLVEEGRVRRVRRD